MDHYLEIRLRSDPEIAPHQLFGALYGALHRALVMLPGKDVGVSFPDYDTNAPSLGTRLRLHGSEASLRRLLATGWLDSLRDNVTTTDIALTPSATAQCRVTRVQAKSSAERMRRRAMRRHGIDSNTAAQRIPEQAEERLRLPFVVIGSRSTQQPSFPLFIRQESALSETTGGEFNSYGLGHGATVPWF